MIDTILDLYLAAISFMVSNQINILLVNWIIGSLCGVGVSLAHVNSAFTDRGYLVVNKLNGIRIELVNIHFRESFSHMIVKLIFALLGVVSLIARSSSSTPTLTPNGVLAYGGLFLVLFILTFTDWYNFYKRKLLVRKLTKEGVVYIPVPSLIASEKSKHPIEKD